MSDQTYTKKEEARMNLDEALREYKAAADADGLDDSDQASEINDCCFEAGLPLDVSVA